MTQTLPKRLARALLAVAALAYFARAAARRAALVIDGTEEAIGSAYHDDERTYG